MYIFLRHMEYSRMFRFVCKMEFYNDEKSNSIRPKTFAKWSTPEFQDLFARRSSQILIKQLHLSTYMCHLECSTLLLNIVLQMAYLFYTCGVLQMAYFFYTCGVLQMAYFSILVEYSRSLLFLYLWSTPHCKFIKTCGVVWQFH